MKKTGNEPQKPTLDSALKDNSAAGSFLRGLQKLGISSSACFEYVAMICLVGIIVATLIDVIGAKLFNKPIAAGTEVVYFLQVIAIAGALAATKIDGKHIRLEFVDSLPKRLKSTFHFISALLGLGLFIVLAWKSFEYAQTLRNTQEVTAVSRIPLYPLVLWIALCCVPLCLVLLKEMINSAVKVVKR